MFSFVRAARAANRRNDAAKRGSTEEADQRKGPPGYSIRSCRWLVIMTRPVIRPRRIVTSEHPDIQQIRTRQGAQ
jgi:hypothetical protein